MIGEYIDAEEEWRVNIFFWTAAIVAFLIIEAVTTALVSIWFSVGSLAALIACALGADIYIQVIVFVAFSVIAIVVIRKFAVNKLKNSNDKINLDRIVGRDIIIVETVDNTLGTGKAKVNDVEWRVISENGQIINAGESATVVSIDGVKLVARKAG